MLRVEMIRKNRKPISNSNSRGKTKTDKKELKPKLNEATIMRSQISIDQMARRMLDDAMYFNGPSEKIGSVYKSVQASKLWFEFVEKEGVRKTEEVDIISRLKQDAQNKAQKNYSLGMYKKGNRNNVTANVPKSTDKGSGDANYLTTNDQENVPVIEVADGNSDIAVSYTWNSVVADDSFIECLSDVETEEPLCDHLDRHSRDNPNSMLTCGDSIREKVSLEVIHETAMISTSNNKVEVGENEQKPADISIEKDFSAWDPECSQSECSNDEASPRDICPRKFESIHENYKINESTYMNTLVQSNMSKVPSQIGDCFQLAPTESYGCERNGVDLHENIIQEDADSIADFYELEKYNTFDGPKLKNEVTKDIIPKIAQSVSSSIYTDDRSVVPVKSVYSDYNDELTKLTDNEYQEEYDPNDEYGLENCCKCDILVFNSDDDKEVVGNCVSRCSVESSAIIGSKSVETAHMVNLTRINGRVTSAVQSDGWRTGSDDDCFRMPACPAASCECTITSVSENDFKNECVFLNTYSKDTGGGDDDPKGYYTRILRRYADPVVPPPFPYPTKPEPRNRYNLIYGRTSKSPRTRLTKLQEPTAHEASQVNYYREKNERIARQHMNRPYKPMPVNRSPVCFVNKNKETIGISKSRKEANEERGILKLPIIECTFKVLQQHEM